MVLVMVGTETVAMTLGCKILSYEYIHIDIYWVIGLITITMFLCHLLHALTTPIG